MRVTAGGAGVPKPRKSHRKHTDNPPRTLPHNKLFEISQPVILFHIKVTLKEEVEKSSILDLHILAKCHRIQPL